ncbi:MAG TPA: helix-turn-helix domain-containing protein [Nitrospiria bacterium]|nr:helix-turn-helix domain-containing protein [Nitrospiria bacterium]
MASIHVILISDEHALIQGVRDRFTHAAKVTVMHRLRRRLPPASLNDGPVLILVELLHASASVLAKLLRTAHHGSSPCVVIGTSDQLLHACDRLRSLLSENGQEAPASTGALHGSNGSGLEKTFRHNGLELSLSDFMERKFHEFVRKIKLSGGKNLFQLLRHEFEKPLITLTLKETKHNQVQAAELLGMNRNTLRKKIKEFKIPVKRS